MSASPPERRLDLIGDDQCAGLADLGDRLVEIAGGRTVETVAGEDRAGEEGGRPVPALVTGDRLVFAAAEYGVAPGQAAVLYDAADESRVLGGGWIEETFAAE